MLQCAEAVALENPMNFTQDDADFVRHNLKTALALRVLL